MERGDEPGALNRGLRAPLPRLIRHDEIGGELVGAVAPAMLPDLKAKRF